MELCKLIPKPQPWVSNKDQHPFIIVMRKIWVNVFSEGLQLYLHLIVWKLGVEQKELSGLMFCSFRLGVRCNGASYLSQCSLNGRTTGLTGGDFTKMLRPKDLIKCHTQEAS